MTEKAQMIGKKFGRLTPIEDLGTKRVHTLYLCRCECGNEIEVLGYSLRSGNTKSCGCIRRPNLVGYENENGIVTAKVRNQMWEIQCKHCNGTHTQNQRQIKNGARSRQCPEYRAPNWSGLDRWDAIIRRVYGITLAEYEQKLKDQGGVCEICGKPDEVEGRRMAIDHCHDTGKVRGLLCGNCNRGLGNFQDNAELVAKAADYLFKYSNAR